MSKFRVLLVDDERELVDTLAERLTMREIEAKAVTSGPEALELIQLETFDVIVVDVKMPNMGGVECMKKMKQIKPDLPVILLTGHGSQEACEDGWKEGAFDYLMKPISINDLIEKMQRAATSIKREGI